MGQLNRIWDFVTFGEIQCDEEPVYSGEDWFFREACLLCKMLRRKSKPLRQEYNEYRPHSSIGDITPAEFLKQYQICPESLL